jgi:hypothetical protein
LRSLITLFAAIAGGLFLAAFIRPQAAPVPSWPPDGDALVQVNGWEYSPIPAGQERAVYLVPPQDYFVATTLLNPSGDFELVERHNGIDTVVWTKETRRIRWESGSILYWRSDGPLGVPFRPGSEVIVKAIGADPVDLESMRLLGYRSRPVSRLWPPSPEMLVHVCGWEIPNVLPGQEAVILTVPVGSHFVLTNFGFPHSYSGAKWEVLERTVSGDTLVWGFGQATMGYEKRWDEPGPIGVTFQPGSQVIVRPTGSTGHTDLKPARFTGYLTR